MEKSQIFQIWTISIFLLAGWAMTEECEQDNSQYGRRRIFFAIYRGPSPLEGDMVSAARNLGSCRTTAEHAEKMFVHFEAYGIDLGPMRSKPYETYETAKFRLKPHIIHPNGSLTILLNTFYEYAQVTNSRALYSSWSLTAKSDLNGQDKSLPAGYWALFGMFRFSDFGREFCMEYTEWNPLAPPSTSGTLTLPLKLENENWGIGNATGIETGRNLDVFDAHYIMQF